MSGKSEENDRSSEFSFLQREQLKHALPLLVKIVAVLLEC